MYSKVINQEFQNEEYGNSLTKRSTTNNPGNGNSYQKAKYISKISATSKYIKNPKLTSSMKKNHQDKKELSNKANNIANLFSFYKKNKKDQKNTYKSSSHQNEHSSSNVNPILQSYGSSEPNSVIDGVLRGYTNNCSFYVSGSFDLKPKPSIKNKPNICIDNYKRINGKSNRSNYISDSYKTRSVISTTPNSYRRREVLKDINLPFNPKNEKLYSKHSYNSNSNSNRINYYTIKNNNENKVEKMKYKGYQFPIIHKGVIDKIKEKKLSPISNSKNFYFSTESINNLKKYSQRNTVINRQQIVSPNNNKIKEQKAGITNFNNDIGIKMYKTLTNTDLEEKNRSNVFNYFKQIGETKPYDIKRNHTPNIVRIEIKHTNSKNNKNEIINNNKYRYRNELDENILNKTEKIYKPNNKYHHYKINTGNIKDKSRYSFPENIRLREYETKTEIHSVKNNRKNNKDSIGLNYEKKINYNHIGADKSPEKKEYDTNYKINANNYSRSGRQYGLKTEIHNNGRNRSQDIEYEIPDINLYRKRNQKNKSTDKINIKIKEPAKTIINIKKEYSTFERSLKNIRDNEREIKKDKNFVILRGDNSRNHTIFESTNFSKPKRVYKTSTQIQVNRSNNYSLKDEDENNKNYKQFYKHRNSNQYSKNNKNNKNNDIIKNNYYYVMKNLEEEIEVEDEQLEYISLEKIHKKNQKQKMKNSDGKNGYISTSNKKEEDKNNYNYNYNNEEKDNNNKERNTISYCQPSKTNNFIYYKVLKTRNPNKKKVATSNGAQNGKEENKKQNIPSKKPQIKKKYFIKNKNKNKTDTQYGYQETHQQISFIDKNDKKTYSNESQKDQKENQFYEDHQKNENNVNNSVKKSKYSSYFGDSNNNYYEIKSPSINRNKNKEEQDEEEEENASLNENNLNYENQDMQLVRSDNFGIQSENLYVPAEEDKDEKEADEQIFEDDEQAYINNDERNENDGNEMERIDEETETENVHENDEEGEDDESEKEKQNKIGEENVIEEKNENEEEENEND